MEGDFKSEAERRPPPPVGGRNHRLIPSNSDAWSFTAGNCKDFFRRSENVKLDECTKWTNEKHSSYIYHLEMSFIKQLYQSKSIPAHYSRNNLTDIHISRKQLISVHNASEQYNVSQDGCRQKINFAVGLPISDSTSEGTGQNFLDEDHQCALNFESRAKRLKIALRDELHQDQIASSRT